MGRAVRRPTLQVPHRSAILVNMGDTCKSRHRWFHLTPGHLLVGLLAVEGLLLLSERFHWFPFNQYKGWTVLIAVASVVAAMLLMFLWFVAALLFRWRFQFSIRSLLVLTVAVAIPCSWLAVELKRAKRQQAAIRELEEEGGYWTIAIYEEPKPGSPIAFPEPPGPTWLRKLLPERLGDDFFTDVVRVSLLGQQIEDLGFEHLKELPQLYSLDLSLTQVTDAGVEKLQKALPNCAIDY